MQPSQDPSSQPRPASRRLWLIAILVWVLLAAAAFAVYRQLQPAAAQITDSVTVTEAAEMREAGVYFVDVRTPEEYAQVRIPNVPLIPIDELPQRLNEIPKDREVVFVCAAGGRSARARDLAREAGYTLVTSMDGGVSEWQAQNLPVVTGE